MAGNHQPGSRPVCTVADALWGEFAKIHGPDAPAIPHDAPDPLIAYNAAARDKPQAALCLSGGGIRSATFALGVLQALARKRLLTRFHYLSTVSGGGYIGGWLTLLIAEHKGDVREVQDALAGPTAPAEIASLRKFTNYLTPQPGLASTDTWAGIILWVRNVLINWLLFLPALFALPLIALFYYDLITNVSPALGVVLLLFGYACLGVGVYFGALHLPSHAPPLDRAKSAAAAVRPVPLAIRWVTWPILAWAFLVPLVAVPVSRLAMPYGMAPLTLIPIGCFIVMTLAYVVAAFTSRTEDHKVFRGNFVWWAAASFIASVVLGVGLSLGANLQPAILAALGPLWVTLAHLVQSLFYVALRREASRGDLDREWLARLSALKVMPALLWASFAAVCLLLPPLMIDRWSGTVWPWIIAAVSGPGTALLGRSSLSTGLPGEKRGATILGLPIDLVVSLGTVLFAVALFMLLARAGQNLATALVNGLANALAPPGLTGWPGYRWAVDLGLCLAAFGLAYKLGQRINVNRFSMHAVYRARLVRAFLGSGRPVRHPDAFTDIDPFDNQRMTDMFNRNPAALFPVVNIALNLTAGQNAAWNERKAESFTVTPLTCGCAFLHRIEDAQAGRPVRGAYATTTAYGGNERETGPRDPAHGITLGTAMTLSGAAVSPNMGYHSSAATAFLMTLFNVRLGAWLPNPAVASAAELLEAKPPNALFTLAREMLGRTDDIGPAVYLSDGGHFDDLGLYEMIRRRCRLVVVVDAGQDGDAGFGDLGNAARKVFIDFGVKIVFRPSMAIGSRDAPIKPIRGYAFADIVYPADKPDGRLIYLRPVDLPDAPIDVRAFRNANAEFPHETTLDQWFSESRFESYRGLGDAEMSALGLPDTDPRWDQRTLAEFFDDVHDQLEAGCDIERDLNTEGPTNGNP